MRSLADAAPPRAAARGHAAGHIVGSVIRRGIGCRGIGCRGIAFARDGGERRGRAAGAAPDPPPKATEERLDFGDDAIDERVEHITGDLRPFGRRQRVLRQPRGERRRLVVGSVVRSVFAGRLTSV